MINDPTDMVQLIKSLPSRPRGKACIVLTHEYECQKDWAAELARQTESGHIDLLTMFTEDKSLGNQIGQFQVPELFEFLKGRSEQPVLIVSGMEFLKATWTAMPKNIEEFASRIKTWDQSPCLLFAMQYDKILANYDFGRRYTYTFVIDQRETLAL